LLQATNSLEGNYETDRNTPEIIHRHWNTAVTAAEANRNMTVHNKQVK